MMHAQPLPTPHELLQELPASPSQLNFVAETRRDIQQILDGQDNRLLLIVGPCSIHDTTAAKEYATKLRQLTLSVSDTFRIVMRVYFEKPRTTLGWKGVLYDPWLDGSHDIATGMRWTRQLLLDLAEMEVAAATEFLDPTSVNYFGDLVSWGCIGARTTSSQTHRQMASGLPMPVAFKNSIDGNIDTAIHGILNASSPHSLIGMNVHGRISSMRTAGNPYAHIVLRGAKGKPNYDPQSILHALDRLRQSRIPERLLIDCSHDNSYRTAENQVAVFQSVLHQIVEGNNNIRGLLLESHLFAGNQPFTADLTKLQYGVSLTDPCLNWQTTERLILWGHQFLKREHIKSEDQPAFAFRNQLSNPLST